MQGVKRRATSPDRNIFHDPLGLPWVGFTGWAGEIDLGVARGPENVIWSILQTELCFVKT
jgi:hypothetical protein